MPIYRYKCTNKLDIQILEGQDNYVGTTCDHEYEVLYTSFGRVEEEEPLEKCPKCGGTEKERLINTGITHELKGRGWAKDGYS